LTEGEQGVVAGVTQTANKLIGSLPAQFLGLVVLNVVFIVGILWFLNNRDDARERLLTPILAACLQQKDKSP
jgi:hypothetical protein